MLKVNNVGLLRDVELALIRDPAIKLLLGLCCTHYETRAVKWNRETWRAVVGVAATIRCHISVVTRLNLRHPVPCIKYGALSVEHMTDEQRARRNPRFLLPSSCHVSPDLMQTFQLSHPGTWQFYLCKAAIDANNINLFSLLIIEVPRSSEIVEYAARRGNRELMSKAVKETGERFTTRNVRIATARSGNPELSKLIGDCCAVVDHRWESVEHRWECREATSRSGKLELVRFCTFYGPGTSFRGVLHDTVCCNAAVHSGNLDLLKWLRTRTLRTRGATPSQLATSKHQRDQVLSESSRILIVAGQTADLLLGVVFDWDVSTPVIAAERGYLDILKYCKSSRCPWNNSSVLIGAARYGSIDVLAWLLSDEEVFWNTDLTITTLTEMCTAAASKGHIDLLEWLLDRYLYLIRNDFKSVMEWCSVPIASSFFRSIAALSRLVALVAGLIPGSRSILDTATPRARRWLIRYCTDKDEAESNCSPTQR
jgi:hypothetical protein